MENWPWYLWIVVALMLYLGTRRAGWRRATEEASSIVVQWLFWTVVLIFLAYYYLYHK